MNEIKIGLLGLGTVGSGVVKVLETHGAEMQERAGCRLRLHAIADADTTRPREGLDIGRLPLVGDAAKVLDAVHDERFWILTHDDEGDFWVDGVNRRMRSLEERTNPHLGLPI